MNYGDGSSGYPIVITPFHARLNASDYIYMQVSTGYNFNYDVVNYLITAPQPNFGTITTATLAIKKIGE